MYKGHKNILHFPLKCTMKTHAEGVAESIGSVMDSHCQKILKKVSTNITGAFLLIYIRMCLLQDLHDLRISSLYFIVSYIQVLCNFA